LFLGASPGWWSKEMEWCTSITPKLASPDSMVQWGLIDCRSVMDSHKVGAMSGALVASMVGLPRAMRSSTLKMDHS
jgi:hypothetical protein